MLRGEAIVSKPKELAARAVAQLQVARLQVAAAAGVVVAVAPRDRGYYLESILG
jgi:hypothetical protein